MGERKKHDRHGRSKSPRRRSSSRERHHRRPSSSRDHRKASPASRRPPFKRKRHSLPELPFAIGRGRRTNRETPRARSFSLKRRSRSSSRSTSRSSSRRASWGLRTKSSSPPPKRPHRNISFAIPPSKPIASARIDAQVYLALSSLIAVASLSASTPPSLRDSPEAFTLTFCSVSCALALLTGGGLRYGPSREGLTRPLFAGTALESTLQVVSAEMALNSLQLLLWCTISALAFSHSTAIAIDTPSYIWNTNLYYSTIMSLALSSFLVADGVTAGTPSVYFANGYNFKMVGNERNWVLVIISQVAFVSFCLQGMTGCDQRGTEAYCSGLTWGVCLGVICVFLAMGHFCLRFIQSIISRSRRRRRRRRASSDNRKGSMVANVMAFITLIFSAVNAAFLSNNNKSEYSSNNVYFASWISFFVSLNLFLGHFDSFLSSGGVAIDTDYQNGVKLAIIQRDEIKALPPSSSALVKRQSTTSTKSSKSSLGFDGLVKNAHAATACLESIVASRESSGPMLYLDNNFNASGLSRDEEIGWPQMHDQAREIPPQGMQRHDPSRYIPQNGVDPAESASSDQQQKSVRALPAPTSSDCSRQCGTDPVESVSTTSDFHRTTSIRRSVANTTIEPLKEKQPMRPSPPGPAKPKYIPVSEPQTATRTPPLQEPGRLPRIPSSKEPSVHSGVESMTGLVTSQPKVKAHSRSQARKPESKGMMKASMLSLFDENFPGNAAEDTSAAVAHGTRLKRERNSSTEESSPTTLDPPPTLDPSHSSKIRASPSISRASHSIKSGRDNNSKGSKSMSRGSRSMSMSQSYRSKASSAPSAEQSRTSSQALSSTTDGSNGPPTLSDDDSGSHRACRSSGPPTLSDEENTNQVYEVDVQYQLTNGRPCHDISADNLSVVSDPTMDEFDQSQKGVSSFLRRESTRTLESDEHTSKCGSVDQMVMMALKQAYELRQERLRQISSGETRNKNSAHTSSVKGIPRRATSGEPAVYNPQQRLYQPHSSSERVLTKTRSGSGHASGELGRSIRSFYSHDDLETDAESKGDDSSAFAC